jgi:hypothetical protein
MCPMKLHNTFSLLSPQITDGRCKYTELAIVYSCNDVVLRLEVLGRGLGDNNPDHKKNMLEYVVSILNKRLVRILSYDRKELGRNSWEPGNDLSSSIKQMALNYLG